MDINKYNESFVKLASNRVIFFNENFTKKVAAELTTLLLYYDHVSHDDITIYLNSSGGDADGLIQIFDTMKMIKSEVSTICIGKAYSAAGVILAAGAKGKRFAFTSSELMVHGVQFSFPLIGDDVVESKDYYEFVSNTNKVVMEILADHTGHSLEKITKDFEKDVFFNAEDAKKYGLIDKIL